MRASGNPFILKSFFPTSVDTSMSGVNTTSIKNTPHLCKCMWGTCNASFVTEYEAYSHAIDTHSEQKSHTCQWIPYSHRPACGHLIKNKSNFIDHIVTHFSYAFRPITCPECDERSRSRQAMLKHYSLRHKKSESSLSNFSRNSTSPSPLSSGISDLQVYLKSCCLTNSPTILIF